MIVAVIEWLSESGREPDLIVADDVVAARRAVVQFLARYMPSPESPDADGVEYIDAQWLAEFPVPDLDDPEAVGEWLDALSEATTDAHLTLYGETDEAEITQYADVRATSVRPLVDPAAPKRVQASTHIDPLLVAYTESVGGFAEPIEILLRDLLTDLRHWADARGIDWDEALGASQSYHEVESAEQTVQTTVEVSDANILREIGMDEEAADLDENLGGTF